MGAKNDGEKMTDEEAFKKDWETPCQVCGGKPTVNAVKLCGPCCFGEADTVGGNW